MRKNTLNSGMFSFSIGVIPLGRLSAPKVEFPVKKFLREEGMISARVVLVNLLYL
jgi:hypothetical protein